MLIRIAFTILLLTSSSQAMASAPMCADLFAHASSSVDTTLKDEVFERANERVNFFSEQALAKAEEATTAEVQKTGSLRVALMIVSQELRLTKFQAYKLYAKMKQDALRFTARNVYRPILLHGREFMKEIGSLWRAYFSRQSMDLAWMRWSWVEKIFEHGKDESSYGATATNGLVTVLSKISSPSAAQLKSFRESTRKVGRDLTLPNGETVAIKPFETSNMIGLSGMSYPQLSANAILSLLYMHIKLAKEGVRYTFNTGEGGPSFHVALLNPNTTKAELTAAVTKYAIDNGMVQPFSFKKATIERAVERLIEDRTELFKDFTPEDLARAQIVGQLGPALNGARTKDQRLDLSVLADWASNPFYAGTQFKLKQAAKKGSKVNASKVGALTAYLRKIAPGKNVSSPELSVEWSKGEDLSVENLAVAIVATKMATKKPVSIKFGLGQAHEVYDMLTYLRDADALPDHIQLDGSGYVRLPGSGNAPMMDNTSLNITTATMAMDAMMKKLGIRDRIFLEATGDIITPTEALMNLSLGADGVAAARLWMGMGLGCALVMKCSSGSCYYGIASGDGKLFSEGLDPKVVAPKGAKAAAFWFDSYTRMSLESGAQADKPFRVSMGLDNPYNTVRVRGGRQLHALKDVFSIEEVEYALQGRMTLSEIKTHILGKNQAGPTTAEQQATNVMANELMSED